MFKTFKPVEATPDATKGGKKTKTYAPCPAPLKKKAYDTLLAKLDKLIVDWPEAQQTLAYRIVTILHESHQKVYKADPTSTYWMLHGSKIFAEARKICSRFGATGTWGLEKRGGSFPDDNMVNQVVAPMVDAGIVYKRSLYYALGADPNPRTSTAVAYASTLDDTLKLMRKRNIGQTEPEQPDDDDNDDDDESDD